MRTIVVTGTHSVGKTVLCNHLVEQLSSSLDVKMIPEMARILIAKGIPMNDEVSEFGIINYIYEYLSLSRKTKASLVISDRSVFDLYSYISVSHPSGVRDEFLKLAEEVVHKEVEKVETYVYVPIEFELQVDGVRPLDLAYQKTIDEKISELLKYFGAKVLTVTGTVQQRVKSVREHLNV